MAGTYGGYDGPALEAAIRGHILAEGEAVATYALNPKAMGAK